VACDVPGRDRDLVRLIDAYVAIALYLTGVHRWRLGDREQARNELTRVVGLYDFLADRRGEASARLALADINAEHAAYDEGPPTMEPGARRGAQRTSDCAQPSDSTLLEQARAGDADAFAAVYDRHAAAAYGLARRMLHSQDAAQDVVQEAFLSLWRTDAYRSEKDNLRNFVLTIIRNRAIDVLRKDRPRSDEERTDDTAVWSLSAADHNQVAAEQRDTQQRLHAALSTLPDAQHCALELAFFDGLTHTEIALRLNEPIGTIKARIRLGLENLRAELDAAGGR
jgi:RNA polymerase sigma-70 factor (ECF subfamily)